MRLAAAGSYSRRQRAVTVVRTLDEVSDVRWNHNIAYHGLVRDEVPADARSALDVGTGDGLLAAELRDLVDEVVAIDVDRAVIASAGATIGGVEWVCDDVMTHDFGRRFDVVASIATVHHLADLAAGLRRLAALTAPGGTLIVVGLARSSTPIDVVYDAVGSVQHRIAARRHGFWEHSAPKVCAPAHTYRQVRAVADSTLPGARWRRLPLFRYAVIWRRPEE